MFIYSKLMAIYAPKLSLPLVEKGNWRLVTELYTTNTIIPGLSLYKLDRYSLSINVLMRFSILYLKSKIYCRFFDGKFSIILFFVFENISLLITASLNGVPNASVLNLDLFCLHNVMLT